MNQIHKESHELMEDYFSSVSIDDFLDSYLKIETFEGMTIDGFFPFQTLTETRNESVIYWSKKEGYTLHSTLTAAPLSACSAVDERLTFNFTQDALRPSQRIPMPDSLEFDQKRSGFLTLPTGKVIQTGSLLLSTLVSQHIHTASYTERVMRTDKAANESPYCDDVAEAA